MFKDVPSLFGILPSDHEISNFIVANNFQTLRAPVIISNPNISKTTKRIASAGECLSTKGAISSTSYKKQKIMCEVCKVMISPKTKHPPTACIRNCRLKGIVQAEVTHCGYIIDEETSDN